MVGAAIAIGLIAGLGGSSASAAPKEDVPAATSAYLTTMRGLLVGQPYSRQSDDDLIYSGRQLCANEVAGGLTWKTLDQKVKALGMSQAFYRAYVQAAVTAFCPDRLAGLG